jgi:hypothetical protein
VTAGEVALSGACGTQYRPIPLKSTSGRSQTLLGDEGERPVDALLFGTLSVFFGGLLHAALNVVYRSARDADAATASHNLYAARRHMSHIEPRDV